MLKKTITYEDYNGVERTEDFYFNLSKAELIEMELGVDGGYAEMIQRVVDAKDTPTIISIFKKLLLKSYGKKSDDGRRFIKSPEISKEFEQSPAYSDMFMELSTDSAKAADFVNGLIPKSLQAQVRAEMKRNPELKAVVGDADQTE